MSEAAILREERAIYGVVLIASLPFVIAAFLGGDALDPGATLGLLGMAIAARGLWPTVRRPRLPRAQLRVRQRGRGGAERPRPRRWR